MILELDKALFLALNFDGGAFWDSIFWFASGKLTWAPLYILILYLIFRRYGWKQTLLALVFMALLVVAVDQIANFFKTFTPKLRPNHTPEIASQIHSVYGYKGGLYGTVSAHAATCFSIASFSIGLIRSRWYTIVIIMWALLVSYSRIYLGAHYPLDLLFGTINGVVMAIIALKLYHKTVNKLAI